MDFYLCIGSILVFIGICTLTYFYYRQAAELRRTKRQLKETEEKLEEALMDVQLLEALIDSKPKHLINMDPIYQAFADVAEAMKNLKFGDF